jgi:hypothetical protein
MAPENEHFRHSVMSLSRHVVFSRRIRFENQALGTMEETNGSR